MTVDAALSIRQFGGAWRLMCQASPGYKDKITDGLECHFSGLPIPFFNVAFPTRDHVGTDTLDRLAREASAWAADQNVPWFFITTSETLSPGVDADEVLGRSGLAPMMPLTGMFADRITPGPKDPADLKIVVPMDDSGCAALLEINSAAYGMDLGESRSVYGSSAYWSSHFPAVGLAGGQPVSCAAAFMVDGFRYVAFVATHPDHQRRGYAGAVMRRALQQAAALGDSPTFLHATDAGRPVYERMGYQVAAHHTLYIEQRFLDGH